MASIIKRLKDGAFYKCHRFCRSQVVGQQAYTPKEKQDVVSSPTWGAASFDLLEDIRIERDAMGEEVWTQEL